MEKPKQTVCWIAEDIHREIKLRAAREGRKMKDILHELLRKALKKG